MEAQTKDGRAVVVGMPLYKIHGDDVIEFGDEKAISFNSMTKKFVVLYRGYNYDLDTLYSSRNAALLGLCEQLRQEHSALGARLDECESELTASA